MIVRRLTNGRGIENVRAIKRAESVRVAMVIHNKIENLVHLVTRSFSMASEFHCACLTCYAGRRKRKVRDFTDP